MSNEKHANADEAFLAQCKAFRARFVWQLVLWAAAVVLVLPFDGSSLSMLRQFQKAGLPVWVYFALLVGCMAACSVLSFLGLRCPNCRRYHVRFFALRDCPTCGFSVGAYLKNAEAGELSREVATQPVEPPSDEDALLAKSDRFLRRYHRWFRDLEERAYIPQENAGTQEISRKIPPGFRWDFLMR